MKTIIHILFYIFFLIITFILEKMWIIIVLRILLNG